MKSLITAFCFKILTDSLDMRFEDESDEAEEEGMENVERGYRGIHLSFPLKRADLELLIETFRKRKARQFNFKIRFCFRMRLFAIN